MANNLDTTCSYLEIDGQIIGPHKPTYFIAEAGLNHNTDIKIAKKLPNELIIIFEEIVPIAIWEANSDQFLISSSGKLVRIANHEKYNNLPQVYEMESVEEFVIFHSMLREAEFPIDVIRNFVFFKIGRWDLELFDKTIIKLPSSNVAQSLKKLNSLLKSDYLGSVNLIDLRVENQIITE